jgi:hypothetical protein
MGVERGKIGSFGKDLTAIFGVPPRGCLVDIGEIQLPPSWPSIPRFLVLLHLGSPLDIALDREAPLYSSGC